MTSSEPSFWISNSVRVRIPPTHTHTHTHTHTTSQAGAAMLLGDYNWKLFIQINHQGTTKKTTKVPSQTFKRDKGSWGGTGVDLYSTGRGLCTVQNKVGVLKKKLGHRNKSDGWGISKRPKKERWQHVFDWCRLIISLPSD